MNPGTTGRLWLGLGLSLALHAALLVSLRPRLPEIHFAAPPPSLSVSLNAIEPAEQAPAPSRPAARPRREKRRQPLPKASQAAAAPVPAPIPRSEKATSSTKQAVEAASQAAPPALDRARIVQRLRRDLRARFTYPPLARRRNIEGRVTLGFDIDGSGAIRDVRVVESSGHAILDMAAERTLRRLHRVQWYPALSGGRSTEIELPVVYRLNASQGT